MSHPYRTHHQTQRPKVWTPLSFTVLVLLFVVLPCLAHLL